MAFGKKFDKSKLKEKRKQQNPLFKRKNSAASPWQMLNKWITKTLILSKTLFRKTARSCLLA